MVCRESSENYLKAIMILKQRRGEIRCIDLARYMGYSRASVSHAVALLRKKGFLEPGGNGLNLTAKGEELSKRILEKHSFFTRFLVECGVERKKAEMEACGIEHVISDESLEKIKDKMILGGFFTPH